MANRNSEVKITVDSTQPVAALRAMKNEIKRLEEQYKKLDLSTKAGQKRAAEMRREMNTLESACKNTEAQLNGVGKVIDNLSNANLRQLNQALRQVKKQMNVVDGNDLNRIKELKSQYAALTNEINKRNEQLGMTNKLMGKQNSIVATAVRNITAYVGVFGTFNLIKNKLTEVYNMNKQFSDQLANIRKVSGLAMEDINRLSNSLAKIDTRSSIQELNELAYTGSKLGFGEHGIEGLEGFVKSAVKVQNALKEDMGGEAMTQLSKMVEVMGLIPKMGVEKAMDAVGSSIFKLASTSTATGSNIVEFTKRLMGLSNQANISSADLLAFGSAADSLALMPEVASTAFNKMITAIQKQPNVIEKALAIPKGTISDMYQMGQMTEAIMLIFEKMREKGGMNALLQSGVIKDLGGEGARLVNVLSAMSNRVDIVNKHLQTSRQAFEEGVAVAQEYAIQMETAEAYAERSANLWIKAFVNPEGVDVVKELTKAWYEVSKSLTQSEKAMTAIKLALQGFIYLLKTILTLLPEITLALGIGGLAGGLGKLYDMFTSMKAGEGILVSLTTKFNALSLAKKAFFSVTGYAALALTLFEIGKAIYDVAKKTKAANTFMKDFKEELTDLEYEFGKNRAELDRYKKSIDQAVTGTKQRAAAIKTFNDKFGQYLKNMLTEKSTALDVAKAYNEVTKAMRAKLALQLKEKDIEKEVTPRIGWAVQNRQEYDRRAKEAGMGQYGADWIAGYAQDNQSKSIDALVKDIGKQYYNLPQQVLDAISVQAANGAREFNNYGNIINNKYLKQANALLAAGSYLRQERSATNAQRRVNQKWKPEQDTMDAYLADQNQPEPIAPLADAPDKDAQKALTKAQQEEKKRLRKEMEDAEKDSTAVINAIEEFYRLQESGVEQMAADGKMTRQEADRLIDYVRNRKDKMLLEARRAISGKENSFEELRQTMDKDLLRPDDTASVRAKETVQTIDVNAAATRLAKFDGSKGVYDLNSGSFTQSMLKNAAQNELNIQRRDAKVAEEIDKLLLQYQYVEQSQRELGDNLVKLGIVTEGYEKVVQQLADGTEITANTKEVADLGNKVTSMGSDIFNVNPDNAEDLANMISRVMTDAAGNQESFASIFPDLDQWMQQPEQYKKEMQAFYDVLLQYEGSYYDAQKKSYDLEKKRFQERWDRSGAGEAFSDAQQGLGMMQRENALTGADKGVNFAQQSGFAAMGEDPEVAASLLRMEQARQELELVRQISEDKKLIHEKEQAFNEAEMAAEETVMSKIGERISKLQEWTDPIEQFGAEVGDAMGKAVFESESMAEGMKKALASMAKSWGEHTIKIVKELILQRLKEKVIHKAMMKDTKNTEEQQTEMAEESGEARLEARSLVETGIASVTQQMGQEVLNAKKVQDSEEMAAEGTKATGSVLAGIAEGAAKIIGTLGPWGAPLIAVITALLMGLLTMALNALGGGGGEDSADTGPKVKLVSGMLTYDSGNVQSFSQSSPSGNGGARPVVASDGRVYNAKEGGQLQTGLVTSPVTTMINGQPSIVGERGPEMVIGRETTHAMQMNRPDLLREIVKFDRHRSGMTYRAYDDGNISDLAGDLMGDLDINVSGTAGGGLTSDDISGFRTAVEGFTQMMLQIQRNGLHVNKYGRGGLVESAADGADFLSRQTNNRLYKRK